MKLNQIVLEANVAAKLKDPKMVKMLSIAMRHDGTLPKDRVAKLGPKPSDDEIVKLWSDLLDSSLSSTDYGNLSTDGKFDEWLTRMYVNGVADFEDINGEGGDALGAWKALSIRGKLAEKHQDFNKFKNLRQIQQIVQSRDYRDELRRIKDAEVIEKHKREKKETTLIDDERFLITLPYNYGACYNFNNSHGFNASFCTGSSSGQRWFERYSPEGPIISIFDKQNQDDENGKWQMHAPTGQMNNGNQSVSYSSGDKKFAELYPGLMKEIIAAVKSNAEEIKANSVDGLDHCGNFLQYDVKWCKNVIGKNCCPSLPDMESVSDFCCSISTNPCCPPPECVPSSKCDECPEDPCTANGWIIIPCSEINLA